MKSVITLAESKSQFTSEGDDKINEALNAMEAYNTAATEDERASARSAMTAAISSFPGALYKSTEEFEKDFFSDSNITL